MSPRRSSKQSFEDFRAKLKRPKDKDAAQADGSDESSTGIPPSSRELRRKRLDLTKEQRRNYLRAYARWLRPFLLPLLGVFILALIGVGASSVSPIVMQRTIDRAILADIDPAVKIQRLKFLGGVFLALAVTGVVISALRGLLMTVLNAKVTFRLRQRIHHHLLHLPLDELSDMKTGGIVSRLSGDVDTATGLVQTALISPAVALIQAVVAIGIIFYWNWRLAAAACAAVPPLMLLHFVYVRRIRPIYRSMRDDRGAVDGRVSETFGGIRVVRAFRRETREKLDYTVGHDLVIRKSIYAHVLQMIVNSCWGLLMPGVSLVILFYGGYLVVNDAANNVEDPTTLGQLFMFQGYIFLVLGPVMSLVNSMTSTQRALAAMERVFDVLDKPMDKPDKPDAIEAPPIVETITFENMHFGYDQEIPVISDFSLTVPGRSVVALVGPSGAGKTTLTDLIARFYDPTQGAIKLNGVDLRDFTLQSYRNLLGIVQQEVFLFDGSVTENISYGRRLATEDEIIDAARRANAHEFIIELPNAYDTFIGERGVKLSGGQRQRLSIARAILADPRILILDEATSNLDTENEQLIQKALEELYANRTTFVIAHRLSTITHADLIVVIDQGRIVEQGNHSQLMANGGMYSDMVMRQDQNSDQWFDSSPGK